MYKVGDILLYNKVSENGGTNKGDRFYVLHVTNNFGRGLIQISDSNNFKYTLTEEYVNTVFITLTEHRRNIINDLI